MSTHYDCEHGKAYWQECKECDQKIIETQILKDQYENWQDPNISHLALDEPVLVLVKEKENNTKWQYVCWPPDGYWGWLLCMPDCKQNADIELDKLKHIEILGWKRIKKEW